MQIFVKQLDGQKKALDVDDTQPVKALKEDLANKNGLAKEQLRLVFQGSPMNDDLTLKDSNVKAGDVIHMIIVLKGGC